MDRDLQTAELSRQRTLSEQAAAWLLSLEEDVTDETNRAFRAWLSLSPEHMRAFLEIAALDGELPGSITADSPDLDTLVEELRTNGRANVQQLPGRIDADRIEAESVEAERVAPEGADVPESGRRWRGNRLFGALAAGVVLAAMAALLSWWTESRDVDYRTTLGEQRAFKLDDGSLVQLNTQSHIRVHYTKSVREIRLYDGEALFTVEHDSRRPFRVLTDSARVQAVGTEFNVYRHREFTSVAVLEGRVKVSSDGTGAGEAANDHAGVPREDSGKDALAFLSGGDAANPSGDRLLESGDAVEIAKGGGIINQSSARAATATAWRQRQLSFNHDRLDYVAEQFNRYNRLQIRVGDAATASRELEGVFDADRPLALLQFLGLDKTLRVEQEGDVATVFGSRQ